MDWPQPQDPPLERRLPPLLPASTTPAAQAPTDALRSLLHTHLRVHLTDSRVLTGYLTAVDRSASLLLSSVRETRILPGTGVGRNVARFYPSSRDEAGGMPLDFESDEFLAAEAQRLGPGQEEQLEEMSQRAGAGVRVRELASVLVPMQHVSSVAFVDEEVSRMWSRFTGVEIRDGAAVPPEVPSQSPQGAATALLPPVPISQA